MHWSVGESGPSAVTSTAFVGRESLRARVRHRRRREGSSVATSCARSRQAGHEVARSSSTFATARSCVRAFRGAGCRLSRGRALLLLRAGGRDRGGERRRNGERDRGVPRSGRAAPRPHELVRDVRARCRARQATEEDGPPEWELGVPYKRTKLEAERLVLAAAAEGLDALCVNPTTPMGEGDTAPTPTGAMVRGVASGRFRASLRGRRAEPRRRARRRARPCARARARTRRGALPPRRRRRRRSPRCSR